MADLKLLIADDDENIRKGLKCILDQEEFGYKICGEASNGNDAIEQINNLNPDLIIQDIKMPGASGLDAISKVKDDCEKNNKVFPSFIILSGFSDFCSFKNIKTSNWKNFSYTWKKLQRFRRNY